MTDFLLGYSVFVLFLALCTIRAMRGAQSAD